MRHVGRSRSFVSKQVLLFISSRDRDWSVRDHLMRHVGRSRSFVSKQVLLFISSREVEMMERTCKCGV
jgi:hypothetical protein